MANIPRNTSRRLKFVRLTDYRTFSDIKQILLAVPDDVTFLGIEYDILTASHFVLIEHPTFDEVPEGMQIPELVVTVTSSSDVPSMFWCSCGAAAVGSSVHSTWCSLY